LKCVALQPNPYPCPCDLNHKQCFDIARYSDTRRCTNDEFKGVHVKRTLNRGLCPCFKYGGVDGRGCEYIIKSTKISCGRENSVYEDECLRNRRWPYQ